MENLLKRRTPFTFFLLLFFMLSAAMSPNDAGAFDLWDKVIKPGIQKAKKSGEEIVDKVVKDESESYEDRPAQQREPGNNMQNKYSSDQVSEAQRLLIELGYKPGPVDGVYGKATGEAIRAYEGDYDLPEIGEPTDKLLAHMTETLNAREKRTFSSGSENQSNISSGNMSSAAAGMAGDELNYQNLFKLYIARHGDLLDNEAFAWEYFKIFKAPENRSAACSELQKKTANPVSLPELVKEEKKAFRRELPALKKGPVSGIFTMPATVVVEHYSPEREAFNFSRMYISGISDITPLPGCSVQDPPGPSYAPRSFSGRSIVIPGDSDMPEEIHLDKDSASKFFTKQFTGGYSYTLNAVATLEVDPLPFIDSGRVEIPGRVIGLSIKHPISGKVLHGYTFARDFQGKRWPLYSRRTLLWN